MGLSGTMPFLEFEIVGTGIHRPSTAEDTQLY